LAAVKISDVAWIPKCAECHAIWLPADEEHWQAWIRTTSRASWLSVFCPECAKREFGD
jgi:hypothetical protein